LKGTAGKVAKKKRNSDFVRATRPGPGTGSTEALSQKW